MADPLSITASVITVIGAAESISKRLSKIRKLQIAPAELLALINEISDLRVVVGDVESCTVQTRPDLPQQFQTMLNLVDRAKGCLLQIDQLIVCSTLSHLPALACFNLLPSISLIEYKVSQ